MVWFPKLRFFYLRIFFKPGWQYVTRGSSDCFYGNSSLKVSKLDEVQAGFFGTDAAYFKN
jgi:hypothetical protein